MFNPHTFSCCAWLLWSPENDAYRATFLTPYLFQLTCIICMQFMAVLSQCIQKKFGRKTQSYWSVLKKWYEWDHNILIVIFHSLSKNEQQLLSSTQDRFFINAAALNQLWLVCRFHHKNLYSFYDDRTRKAQYHK